MKPHPALVYGRIFARAGYVSTRKRWALAEGAEGSSVFSTDLIIRPFLKTWRMH